MMMIMTMKHTRVDSSRKKKTREGEQHALADDAYDQGHKRRIMSVCFLCPVSVCLPVDAKMCSSFFR